MKKLISMALAAFAAVASAEYASIDLVGSQTPNVSASVAALNVKSTSNDVAVSVYGVSKLQSFTNVTDITSFVTTNIVHRRDQYGVYENGPYVYTNSTGNTYVLKGSTNTLSWVQDGTNTLYIFTNIVDSVTNVAYSASTNSVLVGGRAYTYSYRYGDVYPVTNIVTWATTNVYPVLKEEVTISNLIAEATCDGGFASVSPTNRFIVGGERLVTIGLDAEGETTSAKLIIIK